MKQQVLASSIKVGNYVTTNKPTDVWWKVLAITEDRPGQTGNIIRFKVINKRGYEKTLSDNPSSNRKWYRWIKEN